MIAFLALAVLTAGARSPEPAAVAPTLRIERGRVVRVGPRMPDSGYFAVYRDFDIVQADRAPQRMYVLWAFQGQYMPEAGALCTITYRREALLPGNMHRPERGVTGQGARNVVYALDCGLRPGDPPFGQLRRELQRGRPSAR